VCFFCFLESTLVQKGPGGRDKPGDCLPTLRTYADAGFADPPLTLLGAPSQHRGDPGHSGTSLGCRQDREPGARSHLAVRRNRGSDAIHSTGAALRDFSELAASDVRAAPTFSVLATAKRRERYLSPPHTHTPTPTHTCVCVCGGI
jgi:hypothetical protein